MHAENVEECKQIQLNKATYTARYPQQHNTTYYNTPAKSDKFLNHSRHQKAQKRKTYDCVCCVLGLQYHTGSKVRLSIELSAPYRVTMILMRLDEQL